MKGDLGIEVACDPKLLAAVRASIRCYLARFGFSEARVDEAVLAVDEACTNTIRHAYGGRPDNYFRLSLSSTRQWVVIELRDGGRPCRAEAAKRKKVTGRAAKDGVTPGGLGVQLMYTVFDKVEFHRGRTRGNHIVMKLRRESPASKKQRKPRGSSRKCP